MIGRAAIVITMLAAAAIAGAYTAGAEAVVDRASLASLPLSIDRWHGRDAAPLSGDVVSQLGVDDYIHRSYAADGAPPIGLYAGYYASQRQGDTIHSPQNCLPGTGWHPVSSMVVPLVVRDKRYEVNKYVIQKGMNRQVVLYWYQGRGRVVANEFRNKALLMWDAATLRRTNGGLVRVMTPQTATRDATSEIVAFATALLPTLERLMP